MKEEQQSIPPQYEGKQIDLEAKSTFDSEMAAKEFYLRAESRLLRAFEWYNIAKVPGATFVLTDHQGNEILREMHENDILRIDIPGPGSSSGSGYDWVRVDKIDKGMTEKGEYCTITLRPTSNPTHDDEETAHFFKSMATSTLLVKRENLSVIAADTAKLTDKIRNIVVGLGAKLGFSFSQWKSLIEGLVEKKGTNK
jgi:hypothetical protein